MSIKPTWFIMAWSSIRDSRSQKVKANLDQKFGHLEDTEIVDDAVPWKLDMFSLLKSNRE